MVRGIVTPTIIVIAVVIALVSISYPSVVVSNVTTQPLPGIDTYTSRYQVGYPQAAVSTTLAGYSTVTAWYPGNPICDPASNACTPYPTPTATFAYPQSITYTYQVILSSQTVLAFTSGFTQFYAQTTYRNIPPYAAVGLTEFQYGILALAIFMVAVLTLLFIYTKEDRPNTHSGVTLLKLPDSISTAGESSCCQILNDCGDTEFQSVGGRTSIHSIILSNVGRGLLLKTIAEDAVVTATKLDFPWLSRVA